MNTNSHLKIIFNCQLEEFLDLFEHIIKQFLTNQFHKKEASFIKRIEMIRDIIKNQHY